MDPTQAAAALGGGPPATMASPPPMPGAQQQNPLFSMSPEQLQAIAMGWPGGASQQQGQGQQQSQQQNPMLQQQMAAANAGLAGLGGQQAQPMPQGAGPMGGL